MFSGTNGDVVGQSDSPAASQDNPVQFYHRHGGYIFDSQVNSNTIEQARRKYIERQEYLQRHSRQSIGQQQTASSQTVNLVGAGTPKLSMEPPLPLEDTRDIVIEPTRRSSARRSIVSNKIFDISRENSVREEDNEGKKHSIYASNNSSRFNSSHQISRKNTGGQLQNPG